MLCQVGTKLSCPFEIIIMSIENCSFNKKHQYDLIFSPGVDFYSLIHVIHVIPGQTVS